MLKPSLNLTTKDKRMARDVESLDTNLTHSSNPKVLWASMTQTDQEELQSQSNISKKLYKIMRLMGWHTV